MLNPVTLKGKESVTSNLMKFFFILFFFWDLILYNKNKIKIEIRYWIFIFLFFFSSSVCLTNLDWFFLFDILRKKCYKNWVSRVLLFFIVSSKKIPCVTNLTLIFSIESKIGRFNAFVKENNFISSL